MSITRITKEDTIVLMDNAKQVLAITELQDEKEQDCIVVVLEGSLKSDTVHEFQDEMITLAIFGMNIKMDFAKVTYVSSACVQALLKIQQKMDNVGKGSLTIIKLPSQIRAEFDSTGISELLMIED